jgi:hypothetical protein
VSGQLHAPATLPSGKEPPVPLERRVGGPQNLSERREEKKNLSLSNYKLVYDNNVSQHPVARSCIHSVPGFSVFRATSYHNLSL